MAKKIRMTKELMERVGQVFNEGVGSLTRPQLRALHRKGYLSRQTMRRTGATMYYEYGLKSTF